MSMEEIKECALCGEEIEDEDYHELPDGRIVCDYCYENEMDELNEQYDLYINDLREKLSSIKEERKKTENDYNTIKHRLTLLKNQEKINYMNYQNIRFQLKEMKKNRIESQKRIQKNLGKKVNFQNKNKELFRKLI